MPGAPVFTNRIAADAPTRSRFLSSYSFMMTRPAKVLWLALLIGWQANGCALLHRPPVADLTRITPQEIYSRVQRNFDKIQTLTGRGRLIVEMPGAQFAGHAKILVKKPDSLFITAKAILGVEVGFFFANREHFSSYSPLENIYYTGPVDQMHQLILFEMQLSYEQLLHAILGTAQLRFDDSTRVKVVDNQYVFARPWGDYFLVQKIDPGKYVVTEALLIDRKGKIHAKQTFTRFRKIDGVWLPQIIRLFRPQTRERLTIYYESVKLNRPLKADAFVFTVPENARRVQLNGK